MNSNFTTSRPSRDAQSHCWLLKCYITLRHICEVKIATGTMCLHQYKAKEYSRFHEGFIFAKLGDRENKVSRTFLIRNKILQYKNDEMVRLFPS